MWAEQGADQAVLTPGRHAWEPLGLRGLEARKQSPEVGSSSPRIPKRGGGRAGLGSGLLACQPRALLAVPPSLLGRDRMFSWV